jgi:hypothetical protein
LQLWLFKHFWGTFMKTAQIKVPDMVLGTLR